MSNQYQKIVVGIVALLLAIIIGIMVYWETASIDQYADSTYETFTSDSDGNSFVAWNLAGSGTGSNFTGEIIELSHSASSITNISCWDSTSKTASWLETKNTQYSVNGKYLTLVADQASNFTQVNVTYVSNIADAESGTSDMAGTVFALAPIIALVIIAAVLISVIFTLGSGGKKGGL